MGDVREHPTVSPESRPWMYPDNGHCGRLGFERASAEDVLQSLEQARPRPHVLDDYTIGRVREAHGTQLNDLWWYTEQLARWQRASPTSAQQQKLDRLTQQLAALRRVLTASLALAEELQAGTIEKVLAKDDVALALEYLL